MTDSRFQQRLAALNGPQLVKDAPQDDAAEPASYEAVRRIRSFHFYDVAFRFHTGAVQAFPWAHLRGWLRDDDGRRVSFIWPEAMVVLTGRHLDTIEEDVMRRIVAELRQAAPGEADTIAAGVPVITGLEVHLTADAGA